MIDNEFEGVVNKIEDTNLISIKAENVVIKNLVLKQSYVVTVLSIES